MTGELEPVTISTCIAMFTPMLLVNNAFLYKSTCIVYSTERCLFPDGCVKLRTRERERERERERKRERERERSISNTKIKFSRKFYVRNRRPTNGLYDSMHIVVLCVVGRVFQVIKTPMAHRGFWLLES